MTVLVLDVLLSYICRSTIFYTSYNVFLNDIIDKRLNFSFQQIMSDKTNGKGKKNPISSNMDNNKQEILKGLQRLNFM